MMGEAPPSDRLFIGGLPADINDNKLKEIFGPYGTITNCKALPPKTPGQKGAGLVQYSTLEEAKWLLENVNGNIPQGLTEAVIVKYKSDNGKGGMFAGKGGGGGGGLPPPVDAPPCDSIFVGDLPMDIDEAKLRSIFEVYGTVVQCKALPPKMPSQKGAGLVQFASLEEAQWVVDNVNGNIPQGLTEVVVVKYKDQSSKGYGKDGGKGYGKVPGGCAPAQRPAPYVLQPPAAGAFAGSGKPSAPPPAAVAPYGAKGPGAKGPGAKGAGGPCGAEDKGKGKGKGGKGKGPSNCDVNQVVKGLGKSGVLPHTGKMPDENQVYVRGLPANCTDLHLYQLFGPFGAIPSRGVKAMLKEDGTCSGIGFVDYAESHCAQAAQRALNGASMPDGSSLDVCQKRAHKGGSKGEAPV